MPINNLAGNYCALLYSDLYLFKKIDTKKIKYEALKSLCLKSTLTLKQVADLETLKNRIFEKKMAMEVLEKEMKVIEQDIFNLLEELNVNEFDYPYLENTFRFRRQTINQKILVEKL